MAHDVTCVLGARGMVGRALTRALAAAGDTDPLTPSHAELDLLDPRTTADWFAAHKPARVYVAAARVGGIIGNNTRPAEFGRENALIAINVLEAVHRLGDDAGKVLFLGSSCIYPKHAQQPIAESELLAGPLEPTNEMYALAKILGLKLCDAYRRQYGHSFISCMPCNLYGPHDNYHPEYAHVIPSLMLRFHQAAANDASEVVCWGDGTPMREFLHVDDLAAACLFLMRHYDEAGTINVGTGDEITLRDLAGLMAEVTGFTGSIRWDASRPNGTPRKVLDTSRINALGWRPRIDLPTGLRTTHAWMVDHLDRLRAM
ncbi:MAG: GDP-L-fucose synthase family protein [Planctomycetota bacterium]